MSATGGDVMDTGKWSMRVQACLWSVAAITSFSVGLAVADDLEPRPPGGRQIEYKGKLWPPFPRPVGKEARHVDQYHYTHYWPHPQNCEDRSSVRAVMNIQAANGWVEATTLFNYHFDPETHALNSSGVAHLEYILFRVPAQYRTAFVQRARTAQADQLRVASVQAAASDILQDGSLPPIALRRARAYGTSAEEVDMISRKFIAGTPTPRLGGGAGAGGAGSAASGGGTAPK